MHSDSEVNIDEEVNVSDVGPASVECSTGSAVAPGWKLFQ